MRAQRSNDLRSGRLRPYAEPTRIFVHIGLEKTGSSSLQEWLAGCMADDGTPFFYPAVGLVHHHHLKLARALGFSIPGGDRGDDVRDDFAEAILAARSPVIISSEHFSISDTPEAIARLADYLRGHEVTVVVFLRNQVDYLVGLYEEHIKWGGSLTFQEYYHAPGPILSHKQRLERWADAFGAQSIMPLIYEDQPDTVSAFSKAVLGSAFVAPERPRINGGLPQVFLEAVRRANLNLPAVSRRPHFDRAAIALEGFPRGRSPIWPLPRALLDSLVELDQENKQVARRFFAGRRTLFPLTLTGYAERYARNLRWPAPETEEAIEVISRLVARA